jgi:nucleoside-diphosphate-sugar epimerase
VRIAVTGATGVVGRSAVVSLVGAGHEVVALARTPEKALRLRAIGAEPCVTSLFDAPGLSAMFDGADVVCNLTNHLPAGRRALRPQAWKLHDRVRSEGTRRVVEAAREARVRRVVQGSVSCVYADHGDSWVDEHAPVEITCATEPVSVGELHVQDFAAGAVGGRTGVVLRFGVVVGDDASTRATVRAARHGHPVGLGAPDGWAHVIHTDDLGPAVLAALAVQSGVYNVGAEPVRRRDLAAGYAYAAGRDAAGFVGVLTRRFGGARLEPLTRSLRVSSGLFTAQSGWTPRRPRLDESWFVAGLPREAVR